VILGWCGVTRAHAPLQQREMWKKNTCTSFIMAQKQVFQLCLPVNVWGCDLQSCWFLERASLIDLGLTLKEKNSWSKLLPAV